MDYELAARQLLRALRGSRSQRACNRRLGYSSNVTHAWETGSRQASMTDLFRLARLAGVDAAAAAEGLMRNPRPLGTAEGGIDGATWLRELMVGWSVSEMARELGCNRNTVARWLRGQTEPRVGELLRLVQVTTQRVLDFVARLVALEHVPAFARHYEDLERQRRIAYEMPWAHAVLHVLELEAYRKLERHEPGFIARLLGISLEQERAALDALMAARQVERVKGRLRPRRVISVDTSKDPVANLRLKAHWARVGSERLGEAALARGALFSHNVFAVSDEGYQQIRRAHLEYYDRLRSIVAEHGSPTRIVLANVQLVPLDVPPGEAPPPLPAMDAQAPNAG